MHWSPGLGPFQLPLPPARGMAKAAEAHKKGSFSKQKVGWPRPLAPAPRLQPPAPHLGQTGISQLAAGCEVQLPQGLPREQGGVLWLGRRVLGAGGLMLQLSVWLWEEAPASGSS